MDNCNVSGLKCVKMTLGEPDNSGRRKPVEVSGSEHIIRADIVISAIGTTADKNIAETSQPALQTSCKGLIVTDECCETSLKNVFAGGDTVTGPNTVIAAIVAGRRAAQSIYHRIINRH